MPLQASSSIRRQPTRTGGFTLIELLVSITIIALLIGITIPALGTSRETSRRLKCMTNLKGIGTGMAAYMNDSKDLLPKVLPLQQGDAGGGNEPGLLDVLAAYVDAPTPRRADANSPFISTEPYVCPSDRKGSFDSATNTWELPTWQKNGTSYEYMLGYTLVFMEGPPLLIPASSTQQILSKALAESPVDWPVLVDAGDWHPLRSGASKKNSLYYKDWHVDWNQQPTSTQLQDFYSLLARMGGRPS